MPLGGGGVMVWAGISYRQRTQLHFIEGNFNAQRYSDEILMPIVMLFIPCHPLMVQHDNTRSHVATICAQFLDCMRKVETHSGGVIISMKPSGQTEMVPIVFPPFIFPIRDFRNT